MKIVVIKSPKLLANFFRIIFKKKKILTKSIKNITAPVHFL